MQIQDGLRPVRRLVRDRLIFSVALGMALLAASAQSIVRGEDAREALPKDGTWVRYEREFDNPAAPQVKHVSKVTFSLVGTVVEDGKPCRWVEAKSVFQKGQEKTAALTKMLIPEAAFLEPGNPAEHTIRWWMTKADGSVVKLPIEPARARIAGLTYAPMFLWTPGALKTLTQIDDPKDFEYQNGQLKGAQAWTGKIVLTDAGADRKSRWESTYTMWRHPELPMGCAQIRVRDEATPVVGTGTTMLWVYRVEDAGTGAKSDLPDNN
jgi:hypothetical protein